MSRVERVNKKFLQINEKITERSRKIDDPRGGATDADIKTKNPFSLDRKAALDDLNIAIDWIRGRRITNDKTVLQRMPDGITGKEEKIPNG